MDGEQDDEGGSLEAADRYEQPEGHQIATANAFAEDSAMVVVFLHAFVAENTVFATAQTVEGAGLAIHSILVIVVVFVFEDGSGVQEAEYNVK